MGTRNKPDTFPATSPTNDKNPPSPVLSL